MLESTSETIVCQIDYNSYLVPNTLYTIELNIDNLGNAIPNDTFQFHLLSFVSEISPEQGKIKIYLQKKSSELNGSVFRITINCLSNIGFY